ncbi:unnamed protein product [Closterium sp. NIES-54]
MSSRRATVLLGVTVLATVAGVAYVHQLQVKERENLHRGVLRDDQLLEEKRRQFQSQAQPITSQSCTHTSSGSTSAVSALRHAPFLLAFPFPIASPLNVIFSLRPRPLPFFLRLPSSFRLPLSLPLLAHAPLPLPRVPY